MRLFTQKKIYLVNIMAENKIVQRPKIFLKDRKKNVFLLNKNGTINQSINKSLRDSLMNIDIPRGYFIDTINKTLRKLFKEDNNKLRRDVVRMINTNPTRIRLPNQQLLNLENEKVVDRGNYATNTAYEIKGNILYKTNRKQGEKLFEDNKRKNENLVVFNIFNYEGENEPTDIEEFIDIIKYDYNRSFTTKDKTRPLRRVLLKFGRVENGEEPMFRWFPLDDIDNLEDLIDSYEEQDFGSDNFFQEVQLISMERLDMSWFRISLVGSTLEGGASNQTAVNSKYWYCDQPKTKDNLCLEGSIKRFLKIKNKQVKIMRYEICSKTPFIKYGDKIPITLIPLYEIMYQININVYEDTQHYQNGNKEANLILKSKTNHPNTMKVLFKDNHYSLIVKPKLKIKELKAHEKKELGIFKKPIVSYVEKMKTKQKEKLKELVVVFDNETIFDRHNENYLQVYGVSWVVWDMDNEFKYNPSIHLNEPVCYYECGVDCVKKFIKFLLNPPQGHIYKPLGFNNSRFDNFSLCDKAKQMGVLNNLFMADGTILYCAIEGIKPVWDASRFLIGMSLDRACKSYNTNPKKKPDLINHYEIQVYYEKNGMDGLIALLKSNEDYINYNKLDCLCLLDLVQKMRNASLQLFNEDIFDYLTLSSMGYKICDKKWSGEEDEMEKHKGKSLEEISAIMSEFQPKFNISKPLTYEDDLFFRKSLTAGRTQSFFGKLDLKTDLAMGDIKSLYPTCMGCYGGNDCPMPYGSYHKTNEYQKDKLGIYLCNIKHQRTKWKNKEKMDIAFKLLEEKTGTNLYKEYAPNVIPYRLKDCPLDWDYKQSISDIHLTSVDIDVLIWATEDEDCIEIIEGFYWEEQRRDLFLDFLDPPKLEKTRQDRLKEENDPTYNEAVRELCKGISNALSGKLLEAIHSGESNMFSLKNWVKMEQNTNITELDILDFGGGFSMIEGKTTEKYSFEKMKEQRKKPSYLGMFIYSYARRLMYKKILSRYLTLYMDTDSACMPLFEWERLCFENNNKLLPEDCLMEVNSGEYGCIEEEVCSPKGCATRLIAISPKNYLVENSNDEKYSKRKFKGVRRTDYFLPLEYFNKENETGREVVRSMSQETIRRYREFGCCKKCINNVLIDKQNICEECKSYKNLMSKCYSTEMFEYLVKGEKIAVFCSMINRIKYRIGCETEWEFSNNVNHNCCVEDMDSIMNGNSVNKKGIIMKVISSDIEKFKEKYKEFRKNFLKISPKFNYQIKEFQIKNAFIQETQRFKNVAQEKELKDVFKLKQRYLVKII